MNLKEPSLAAACRMRIAAFSSFRTHWLWPWKRKRDAMRNNWSNKDDEKKKNHEKSEQEKVEKNQWIHNGNYSNRIVHSAKPKNTIEKFASSNVAFSSSLSVVSMLYLLFMWMCLMRSSVCNFCHFQSGDIVAPVVWINMYRSGGEYLLLMLILCQQPAFASQWSRWRF